MDTTWTLLHDLARLFRVPGTVHGGTGKRVKIDWLDPSLRYAPEQFEQYKPTTTLPKPKKKAGPVVDGNLIMDPDAKLPSKLLRSLTDDSQFIAIWNRQKAIKDTSPSGWDFVLAQYLAGLDIDLNDQEIANSLIEARCKHGDDPKLRSDYYERTISNARKSLSPFYHKPSLIPGVEPYYPSSVVPLEQAEQKLQAEIEEFFERHLEQKAEDLCIRCSAGLGKTEAVIRAVTNRKKSFPIRLHTTSPLLIEFYVPTHELAAELKERN